MRGSDLAVCDKKKIEREGDLREGDLREGELREGDLREGDLRSCAVNMMGYEVCIMTVPSVDMKQTAPSGESGERLRL